MTRRAVYQVDGTIALVGSFRPTPDWWLEWQHDWDYAYGAMIAKPKEKRMCEKKYDWSKLQQGWIYHNNVEDPKGPFIGNGFWRYYVNHGEFVRSTKRKGEQLYNVVKIYEEAYNAVRACEISWQDSAKAAIEGASVSLKLDSTQAIVYCHSSSHGNVMLYPDFTAKLTAVPCTPDEVVALGTVISNLRASGWTVR